MKEFDKDETVGRFFLPAHSKHIAAALRDNYKELAFANAQYGRKL
ncbi:MAG: hypothetical protein WEC59_08220 [Salibacteraceae bacterium]